MWPFVTYRIPCFGEGFGKEASSRIATSGYEKVVFCSFLNGTVSPAVELVGSGRMELAGSGGSWVQGH
jgi:hypothetical protein